KLPAADIPIGNGIALGSASIDLRDVPAPARYKFVVTVGPAATRYPSPAVAYQNDWDVWVYPPKVDTQPSPGVVVADDLNEQALATLNAGGKVLLLIPPSRVKGDKARPVALGFSSIFWNPAGTHGQPP